MFDNLIFMCYILTMKNNIQLKIEQVYNFTVDFIDTNGFPPSVRDICANCDIKSTATAYSYLKKLIDQGLINKSPLKKRALTLPANKKDFISIPLVGTITAGTPIFAVENLDGYIPLPKEFDSNDCFALKVDGESMINSGIYDKDIIIVEKQETADNGDIVVALIDDSATVKRFYKKGNKIVLHPENDNMQDIIIDNVIILGKVKGLLRKF